ncbi:hypothetical protein MTO96_030021 [Rhipicephalus appendiculatus]
MEPAFPAIILSISASGVRLTPVYSARMSRALRGPFKFGNSGARTLVPGVAQFFGPWPVDERHRRLRKRRLAVDDGRVCLPCFVLHTCTHKQPDVRKGRQPRPLLRTGA